jgi:very-short-patch-repair endonuclease
VHSVIVRPTSFYGLETSETDVRIKFHELYQALIIDEKRNQLICADILQSLKDNRSSVVLTERTEHLDILEKELSKTIPNLIVFRGGMGKKKLKETMQRLDAISEKDVFLLLSTGRFLGEGFDNARLDTLFLTMPVSWRGTIAQYAGRLHRLYESKREVRIYDYADLNVPVLSRMFDRRCVGYEAVGYTIMLPASAVPGWPQDVPLPVDPEWKRDYASSVQRLIRDGVDVHLGNLFVYAARKYSPEAKGVDRARSASEAFLYRRLETLPETAGMFNLNIHLPIPFDECGHMEVDLLCKEYRIVIELDGPHHFADSAAYRRDRRKDQLLQENGYFVLRFLTDDIGKYLNEILDAIHRVISHRKVKE